MMQQEPWNFALSNALLRQSKSAPASPVKPVLFRTRSESSFHVAHKVPIGDTPYVRAKRVQLVDKDPEKAIALFWAAINAGDRVDSALKDMAIVMKQQNRAEEAIEAIKSLRNRCSDQAQESLDNILLDLYKRCGRLDDQISLLKHKLLLIQQGLAFNGKRTKTARSQGRKFQVSVEQEATRILGNLGWALMQKENYVEAEAAYRRALVIGADNNKMCNLGICLMKQGRIAEAKETLKQVKPAVVDALRGADSHLKAYERAQEMLRELETKLVGVVDQNWLFIDAFLGSSSIWQPQPCIDYHPRPPLPVRDANRNGTTVRTLFANENVDMNRTGRTANSLNIDAQPFYSKSLAREQFQDPLGNLKRTRSGTLMPAVGAARVSDELQSRKKSNNVVEENLELPDNDEFNEAIIAAVLGPVLEEEEITELCNCSSSTSSSPALREGKIGKRLKVFQDITQALNNCRA